ncbi:MAG TPA: lysozyme inhibitor LprI family protein [Chthoniobacterales bacterium]|nr:lysozyme inhibitor LprI family protein [Chthoniobacterales bacterium]
MRVPQLVVALAACVFPFSQQAAAQTKATPAQSKIIPAEWLPALAPSIKSALDDLKDANSQVQMNLLSRQVADMTDAQLFIAYIRLYERLPQKERDALLAEQAKWLKARTKAATDGVESQGGSLAPLEANNAELTFTEKRLAELRARLKALENKKSSARAADGD